MLFFNCLLAVLILCTASVQCDVSHILGGSGDSVDDGTIEILRKNISNYLIELEHGGNPQMQLKKIYGASKQAVAGTLYTVQTLLSTPDGTKKCIVKVLEKPWIDFCKVSVTCENGGHYEVRFNPNENHQNNFQNPSSGEEMICLLLLLMLFFFFSILNKIFFFY